MFQSLLGRLKTGFANFGLSSPLTMFQSLLGKTDFLEAVVNAAKGFQSLLGRLKTLPVQSTRITVTCFNSC